MSNVIDQVNEKQKEDINVAKTKEELLTALNSEFATGVIKVYVNSLDRECSFKEISVKEQKSLTRMMSGNENRKDLIFDSQCAVINKAALDPAFDIYKLCEFDRLKILMALYQENMFQNEVKFTCQECGAENKYKVDFNNTLVRLDQYKLEKKTFNYENKKHKYTFEVEYPTVSMVSKFYASYCQRHGTHVPKKQTKTNDMMTNLEYVNLFIKEVTMENKTTGSKTVILFDNYKISDREDLLAAFPQDVLYTENGIVKFIVNEYIAPVNASFDKHECSVCGAVHEKEGVNNSESFF